MWWRSRARSAGWKSSTTPSRPRAARATLVPLDLKDYDGIDRLGARLHERYGRLDVLVGNAGMLGRSRRWPCRAEGVRRGDGGQRHRQLAADPLAWIRCCRTPTPGARCSSPRARAGCAMAYWGPYSVSKAAVELLARIYAAETATTKLRVNMFNPGPIRTRMRAPAMPGEDPMTLDTPENGRREDRRSVPAEHARDRQTLYDYRSGKLAHVQSARPDPRSATTRRPRRPPGQRQSGAGSTNGAASRKAQPGSSACRIA